MSDAVSETPENLIKAALTQGIAGLMAQGLAVAAQALRQAKTEGLIVYLTFAFQPDGEIYVVEPQVAKQEAPVAEEPKPEAVTAQA